MYMLVMRLAETEKENRKHIRQNIHELIYHCN